MADEPFTCDLQRQPSIGQCRSAMEIACQTDVEYDTVIFNWRVNNFKRMRAMSIEKGIPPEGDVITSPIYVDVQGGQWWLRLYPYEDREEHKGKVSLFLHTDRATKGDVFFSFHFAALNAAGLPIEDSAGGIDLHKFEKSEGIRNFGFYDLIESNEVIEKALIDNHALWLFCEVYIYSSLVTSLDDVHDIKLTTTETPPPFEHVPSCRQHMSRRSSHRAANQLMPQLGTEIITAPRGHPSRSPSREKAVSTVMLSQTSPTPEWKGTPNVVNSTTSFPVSKSHVSSASVCYLPSNAPTPQPASPLPLPVSPPQASPSPSHLAHRASPSPPQLPAPSSPNTFPYGSSRAGTAGTVHRLGASSASPVVQPSPFTMQKSLNQRSLRQAPTLGSAGIQDFTGSSGPQSSPLAPCAVTAVSTQHTPSHVLSHGHTRRTGAYPQMFTQPSLQFDNSGSHNCYDSKSVLSSASLRPSLGTLPHTLQSSGNNGFRLTLQPAAPR